MPEVKTSVNFSLIVCVCLSILGLVLLPFLLFQSARFEVNFANGGLLVGLLFSSVCLLGVVAVFYPKKCQGTFAFKEGEGSRRSDGVLAGSDLGFEGHHPSCGRFDGNRIIIRGVVFCSACSGLFLGAIFALTGAALYFFFGTSFPFADLRILLVGNAVMLLGLAQFVFRAHLKLIVNALFVVGSFITLVAADLIGGNLLIDLYVLGLIVFLLLTRIMLSEWNNRRICFACENCGIHHEP